jgi:hypothetical protein
MQIHGTEGTVYNVGGLGVDRKITLILKEVAKL